MTALLLVGGAMATLAIVSWFVWPSISSWFRDSETLFFARLQMLVGGLWSVLVMTDVSPVLNAFAVYDPNLGKAIPIVLFAWGVITETARRSRASDL